MTLPFPIYRRAELDDIPAMASIRAADWETEEYWRPRILAYMQGSSSPQHALPERPVFVSLLGGQVVGLTAGHLTRRFGCDAELQWISVKAEHRTRGIASELLRLIAQWFVEQKAHRVCVDVEPSNVVARKFYARHGAVDFKANWMIWHDITQIQLLSPRT